MGKCFGKSVVLHDRVESGTVVWAIYEGEEKDGTKGKEPFAWFRHHKDAVEFVSKNNPGWAETQKLFKELFRKDSHE